MPRRAFPAVVAQRLPHRCCSSFWFDFLAAFLLVGRETFAAAAYHWFMCLTLAICCYCCSVAFVTIATPNYGFLHFALTVTVTVTLTPTTFWGGGLVCVCRQHTHSYTHQFVLLVVIYVCKKTVYINCRQERQELLLFVAVVVVAVYLLFKTSRRCCYS